MVTNIVNTQLVMVSPLRRAMATAVLLLAHCKYKELQAKSSSALELSNSQVSLGKARNRSRSTPKCIELDDASNTWPSFQVVAELREKRKTESEDPGSHGKPMTYIEQTVEKISKKLFCSDNSMNKVLEDIRKTYDLEKNRTRDWTIHLDNVPVPTDGKLMFEMISAFKAQVLQKLKEQNIVVVGHSGWARYAFAPLLPEVPNKYACPPLSNPANGHVDDDKKVAYLCQGAYKISPLSNVGTMTVQFEKDSRTFIRGAEAEPSNFQVEKPELAPCAFADEDIMPDALPLKFTLSKSVTVKDPKSSCKSLRLAVWKGDDPSKDDKYLRCFDEWLTPVGYAHLQDVRFAASHGNKQAELSLDMIWFPGHKKEKKQKFVKKITKYVSRGSKNQTTAETVQMIVDPSVYDLSVLEQRKT
eukprot:TRINITY_DN2762_c0_g2_i2.p1 TRINITY_DN2762_c0_g2~~TRINITY_DN2762_c0_g2_i2.p1  ORF type:complete len:482 (-),score=52.73 TRINITY_DN2762_c0_g2_i2:203-1447(-)